MRNLGVTISLAVAEVPFVLHENSSKLKDTRTKREKSESIVSLFDEGRAAKSGRRGSQWNEADSFCFVAACLRAVREPSLAIESL